MSQLHAINLYIANNILLFHPIVWFSTYFHMDYVYAMLPAIRRCRINASLSLSSYLRLRDIGKLAQGSTGCQVRIKTKKKARCGRSGLKLLTRWPEVSQFVRVEAGLEPGEPEPTAHCLTVLPLYSACWTPGTEPGTQLVLRNYVCPVTIGVHALAERANMFQEDVTPSRSPAGSPSVAPYCHHRQEL